MSTVICPLSHKNFMEEESSIQFSEEAIQSSCFGLNQDVCLLLSNHIKKEQKRKRSTKLILFIMKR